MDEKIALRALLEEIFVSEPVPAITIPPFPGTSECLRFAELPTLNLDTLETLSPEQRAHALSCAHCQRLLQGERNRRPLVQPTPSPALTKPKVRAFPSTKRSLADQAMATLIRNNYFHEGIPPTPQPVVFDSTGAMLLQLSADAQPKLQGATRVRVLLGSKAEPIVLCEADVMDGTVDLRLTRGKMPSDVAGLGLRTGYFTQEDLIIDILA